MSLLHLTYVNTNVDGFHYFHKKNDPNGPLFTFAGSLPAGLNLNCHCYGWGTLEGNHPKLEGIFTDNDISEFVKREKQIEAQTLHSKQTHLILFMAGAASLALIFFHYRQH